MKRMLVAALLLVCAYGTVLAASFEGKAVYEVKAMGRNMDMTLLIKGDKSRVDIGGHEGFGVKLIMDWADSKAYMLMDDRQIAMSVPLMPPAVRERVNEEQAIKPEKTGKTKTILGRECEQWIIRNEGNMVEVWSAKGLGNFTGFMGQAPMGVGTGFPDMSAVTGLKEFFPVSVVVTDKTGRQTFSMQAKSIEPKQLADSDVSVPSSYQIVTTPPAGTRIQSGK